jgi:hypothetical protein
MQTHTREPDQLPRENGRNTTADSGQHHGVAGNGVTEPASAGHGGALDPVTALHANKSKIVRGQGTKVARGVSACIPTMHLQRAIRLRALLTANRFRVIRTIDVAVVFAERSYKAALTAAQRAMRGMVKGGLLKRYRTARFQTCYGLAEAGVEWLEEAGFDAASSVRRVSDMTNPEHRLWAQFLVLASEARGLRSMTEQELLQHLNRNAAKGGPLVQGMLSVTWTRGKKSVRQQLRPDAVSWDTAGDEVSCTWHEADISKRGSQREAALAALCGALGRSLTDGSVLRRVVVSCKNERIRKRALAVLRGLANANNSEVLTNDRRHFREVEPGIIEVWSARKSELKDGRSKLVDTLAGHVIIQLLPTWLPRVRIDASNTFSMDGWFGENYLPYRRPASLAPWPTCTSPLLTPIAREH